MSILFIPLYIYPLLFILICAWSLCKKERSRLMWRLSMKLKREGKKGKGKLNKFKLRLSMDGRKEGKKWERKERELGKPGRYELVKMKKEHVCEGMKRAALTLSGGLSPLLLSSHYLMRKKKEGRWWEREGSEVKGEGVREEKEQMMWMMRRMLCKKKKKWKKEKGICWLLDGCIRGRNDD